MFNISEMQCYYMLLLYMRYYYQLNYKTSALFINSFIEAAIKTLQESLRVLYKGHKAFRVHKEAFPPLYS
jgi:hypothetical protein